MIFMDGFSKANQGEWTKLDDQLLKDTWYHVKLEIIFANGNIMTSIDG